MANRCIDRLFEHPSQWIYPASGVQKYLMSSPGPKATALVLASTLLVHILPRLLLACLQGTLLWVELAVSHISMAISKAPTDHR